MANFLGKCAAIGLLGAGFTLTGDLGGIAARGLRVLEATTVPVEAESRTEPANSATAVPDELPTDPGLIPAGEATEQRAHVPPPPGAGAERIDLSSLAVGERLVVWFSAAGSATGHERVVLDIVEPVSGEALLHRPHGDDDPDAPLAATPPRRVLVQAAASGGLFTAADRSLAVGGAITCRPVGIAHDMNGRGGSETFGPVTALELRR